MESQTSLRRCELQAQDFITARAVAELAVLWNWTAAYLAPSGGMFAIKGGNLNDEISSLSGLEGISRILTMDFPEWLDIEKSRVVIAVMKNNVERL